MVVQAGLYADVAVVSAHPFSAALEWALAARSPLAPPARRVTAGAVDHLSLL